MTANSAETHMEKALELARKAQDANEVPVGALVVLNGQIIAEAWNEKESSKIPTHHAEILAIERAAQKLGRWRLNDCELYVTLEPCLMCSGAIVQARLGHVFYGATDPKGGAVASLYQVLQDPRLNHRPQVTGGVLGEACAQILTDFFRKKRSQPKATSACEEPAAGMESQSPLP
jgi:tRNA(adenine34) deaminase